MDIRLQLVVVAVGLSLLTGCTSMPFISPATGSPSGTSSPSAPAVSRAKETLATPPAPRASGDATPGSVERSAVVWSDYDSGLQNSIDQATAAGDCRGISTFFGMTTATEDSVMAQTGHGNEAVVAYLDEALAIANCS